MRGLRKGLPFRSPLYCRESLWFQPIELLDEGCRDGVTEAGVEVDLT